MLTMAIPNVEISAVCLFAKGPMVQCIRQLTPKYVVQEVGSFRE